LEWQNVAIMFTGPGQLSYFCYQPVTGQHFTLQPEQLAILRYRNWGRLPWQGVAPVVVNANTLSIGLAAQHTAASAFRDGATPGGYLSTDAKLDKQKAVEIQARWNENYGGPLAAGKTAVLEQGLKFKLIERANLVEIQMAELAKANDSDVARAFNVPVIILGEIQSNRANSVEATRMFVSMCLETMAARVGDGASVVPDDQAQLQHDRVVVGFGEGLAVLCGQLCLHRRRLRRQDPRFRHGGSLV
jgi:HK97 family phage portal protein